jgi:hypothetical protein
MSRLICWLFGHRVVRVRRLPPSGRAFHVRCTRCHGDFAVLCDPSEFAHGILLPWSQIGPFYDEYKGKTYEQWRGITHE